MCPICSSINLFARIHFLAPRINNSFCLSSHYGICLTRVSITMCGIRSMKRPAFKLRALSRLHILVLEIDEMIRAIPVSSFRIVTQIRFLTCLSLSMMRCINADLVAPNISTLSSLFVHSSADRSSVCWPIRASEQHMMPTNPLVDWWLVWQF